MRVLDAPTVRGERLIVALKAQPESFADWIRGRAWSDVRQGTWAEVHTPPGATVDPDEAIDLVDVVDEPTWWRHRLLGTQPSQVVAWPARHAWIE